MGPLIFCGLLVIVLWVISALLASPAERRLVNTAFLVLVTGAAIGLTVIFLFERG